LVKIITDLKLQNSRLSYNDGEILKSSPIQIQGYAQLSGGNTHYRIDGVGKPIILVHGATVGMWAFEPIVPFLNKAGYRTIRYDLYGHGLSDRPNNKYDINFYQKQLHEFVEYLKLEEECSWLGHSMGAAILAATLSSGSIKHKSFKNVVLVAPLLDYVSRINIRGLLKSPAFGPILMKTVVKPVILRRRRARLKSIGKEDLLKSYEEQIAMPGYWEAMHSVMIDGALGNNAMHYQSLNSRNTECSILWGTADKVIRTDDIETIRSYLSGHSYIELADMGHNLMLAHPKALSEHIINLLN
jgi:pimeloyl-ACP methyl ester carboxylesterase